MQVIDQQIDYLKQNDLYDSFISDLLAGKYFKESATLITSLVDTVNWSLCETDWNSVDTTLLHRYGRLRLTQLEALSYVLPISQYPEFYL